MSPHWLTMKDAADYLGITYDALRKRVERGEIDSHPLGRRRWFKIDDLDALMEAHREPAWAEPS